MKNIILTLVLLLPFSIKAAFVLIPMDETQKNHLKAYGIAYFSLQKDNDVTWLLNYRGGSFSMEEDAEIIKLCKLRGVSYEVISNSQMLGIIDEIFSILSLHIDKSPSDLYASAIILYASSLISSRRVD